MTLLDLTLQEDHVAHLRSLLAAEQAKDGVFIEGSAYILCGLSEIAEDPWERQKRYRLTSYEIVPIPEKEKVSASATHVTWSTTSYVRLLKRAKDEGLVLGIVHSHPEGAAFFSEQDDANEAELLRTMQSRNGKNASLLSLLFVGQSEIKARLWIDKAQPVDAKSITILGRTLKVLADGATAPDNLDVFDRQSRFFGKETTAILRKLKIGIVGCGGTGSATAMLLARLGVGHLALFDDDIVDKTNLNRLHGSKRPDADAMRSKVEVVAREISDMALGVRVVPFKGWIGDKDARDALKSCDVIFGCTDDNDGRLYLNRFAYFYLIPVIDMGLAVSPQEKQTNVTTRVTVVAPGGACLLCRNVADPIEARDEDLKRKNPQEYERRKREAYVRGGGNPAPAVVTFTTSTACMAVDELLQGLTSFRGTSGWDWQRVRHIDKLTERKQGAVQSADCPICVEKGYWGQADVEPFMDRTG